jgi:hypothetical protein
MERKANRQKLGTLDREFRSRLVARNAGESQMHMNRGIPSVAAENHRLRDTEDTSILRLTRARLLS